MSIRVAAFSSSRVGNSGYLETVVPVVSQFLGNKKLNIAFIPFASVNSYDDYLAMVALAFTDTPYTINVVKPENAIQTIQSCDVIMVGGGNTFKLLHDIYAYTLFDLILGKVNTGTPYIGWSAGANITGLSLSTTNDMPIIEPASFKAFEFLPFQINPHYINQPVEGHNGETRDQRLTEFLKLNPGIPIIGIPEGTALMLGNGKLVYSGKENATLFTTQQGNEPVRKLIEDNTDLSFLMKR